MHCGLKIAHITTRPLINEQLNWLDLTELLTQRPVPKYRAPFSDNNGFDVSIANNSALVQ